MKIKLIVKKDSRLSTFKGRDGDPVDYFWTKGERTDGVNIEFGGKFPYKLGEEIEPELEKNESMDRNGNIVFTYKEIR